MKIGKRKISNLQILRFIIQIAFFIIVPGMYINAFSGIRQIYTGIIKHTFNFAQYYPQMLEAIAIIPVTILLGRFFCGWMCAFGTLGDIIYHISSKVFKVSLRISEKADRVLKYVKYVLLGFLVLVVWSFGLSLSGTNPWDAFGVLASVGKMPDFSYAFTEFTVGSIILMLIIIGSFFIERFFCRYLCPLGAVFAIVSRLKFVKISKTKDKCGACRICTKSCAMGIPLYKYDKVDSGECINCFKCISACPRKNVSASVADSSDVRPVIASTLAIAVMTGAYCAGTLVVNGAGVNRSTNPVTQASAQRTSEGKYADGTYEGSGTGFRGATTTVSVTVKNGAISDIQALSYGDDAPYFSRAYNSVVNEILSTQSTDVDAVSGATFSSNGIMEAVKNALTNAGLSAQVSASPGSAVQSEAGTLAVNGAGVNKSTNPSTQASSQRTSEGKYADGTYEGSGTGFRGATTTVSVTVKNGAISDIQALSYGDDAPYFSRAYKSVVNEILSTQSADVDAVSGATFSSNGIMEAVKNALTNTGLSAQASASPGSAVQSEAGTTNQVQAPSVTTSEAAASNTKNTVPSDSSVSTPKTATAEKSPSSPASASSVASSSDSAGKTAAKPGKSSAAATSSPSQKTAATSKYKDGTYEGSGRGFRRGITTVSVTVKNDKITDVKVVSTGDDDPFFSRASDSVIGEILNTQSTNVDAVSGATFSSNGIMSAVADALRSAEI